MEFYVDEFDTEMFGVFDNEIGKCYASYCDEKEAEKKAKEMNDNLNYKV